MKLRPLFLVCTTAILLPHGGFTAQIFEGLQDPLLQHDPSVRSAAMAGASGAVFWGADPNDWANPALLGTTEGIRYQDALEQYPGLVAFAIPNGPRFIARREMLGYGGLGVALAGQPFEGIGGSRWDFQGEDLETLRSWSAGVSAARVVETAASLLHRRAPTIARHLDLAFGYSRKSVRLPEALGLPPFFQTDWGLLARAGGPITLRGVPLLVEGAYGYSVLNANQAPDRHERNSVGLHLAAGRLPDGFARLPAWFRSGLDPLISLGGAFDGDRLEGPFGYYSHLWGGELALANVLFLRLGRNAAYVSDHDDFRGFGLALPLGTSAGVRYDNAREEGEFSSDIKYRAWSAWVDPLALMRARR
jgi:hypothetical protein